VEELGAMLAKLETELSGQRLPELRFAGFL
jgi:hypothetical protein